MLDRHIMGLMDEVRRSKKGAGMGEYSASSVGGDSMFIWFSRHDLVKDDEGDIVFVS